MPTPVPPKTAASLPDGIEIFRAGRHLDDQGVAHSFSEADVAGMAASYDPALREAPLTIGHPKDNLPAYGWVKGVARGANGALVVTPHQVEPQFAEMVAAGRFKKRSASFYPPQAPNNPAPGRWYLRHVAFLGAQPPAVAGLKDLQFSAADADGAVNFSAPDVDDDTTNPNPNPNATGNQIGNPPGNPLTQEIDDMSKELQAQLEEANAKLAAETAARTKAETDAAAHKKTATDAQAQAASFAEKAKTERKAGFVSFADAQVAAGRLLPKDKDMAVATLDALADCAPVEFAEGDTTRKVSPAQWLQDMLGNATPLVNFGEHAPAHSGAGQAAAGSAKGKSDAEIDTAAKAYARQNKVSYAEALTAVTSFTV